ncbi:MAG: hypothetical protein C0519_04170 [Hyphomicrobium sp.]|nr:hypothetical protein [Hyphomicrobium sp.]PPD07722.1 MAG: hypothetical protein CTY28_07690 [Hyphomicrobium sp.]
MSYGTRPALSHGALRVVCIKFHHEGVLEMASGQIAKGSDADSDRNRSKISRSRTANSRPKKLRLTVSLSEKSMAAFDEIKEATDAYTDSEVIRNALRLQLAVLRAHRSGKQLVVNDLKTGTSTPIELFAAETQI